MLGWSGLGQSSRDKISRGAAGAHAAAISCATATPAGKLSRCGLPAVTSRRGLSSLSRRHRRYFVRSAREVSLSVVLIGLANGIHPELRRRRSRRATVRYPPTGWTAAGPSAARSRSRLPRRCPGSWLRWGAAEAAPARVPIVSIPAPMSLPYFMVALLGASQLGRFERHAAKTGVGPEGAAFMAADPLRGARRPLRHPRSSSPRGQVHHQ